MLVLTRAPNESFQITVGGRICEVKVLRFDGKQIKIGVSAPLDVHIVRSELLDDGRKCQQMAMTQLAADRPAQDMEAR
jgi:carbon storage regulator